MTTHVSYKELAEELINGNWGRSAVDREDFAKQCSHAEWHSALLIDMAQSLRQIEVSLRPLRCSNFQDIPNRLRKIVKNTTKGRRKNAS